jgi:hypothetical protein
MVGNNLIEVNDNDARQLLQTEFECRNLLLYSQLEPE